MAYASKELIEHMARTTNRRGHTIGDMVLELQAARDYIDDPPPPPRDFHGDPDEYRELEVYAVQCSVQAIIAELERRKRLQYDLKTNPDNEIVQTLKERIPIADVVEWFTEVYYSNRDRLKFRCPLHSDSHPSGIIYAKEGRWHCFQCNEHGDIFDAVSKFGRTDFPHAVARLARHIGIDTKPLRRKPNTHKGGVPL